MQQLFTQKQSYSWRFGTFEIAPSRCLVPQLISTKINSTKYTISLFPSAQAKTLKNAAATTVAANATATLYARAGLICKRA